MSCILQMIFKKAKKLPMNVIAIHARQFVDWEVKEKRKSDAERLFEAMKQMQVFAREDLMSKVRCGWIGCGRAGGELESSIRTLKVCGQCQMEYYCSRRCQKKAWRAEH